MIPEPHENISIYLAVNCWDTLYICQWYMLPAHLKQNRPYNSVQQVELSLMPCEGGYVVGIDDGDKYSWRRGSSFFAPPENAHKIFDNYKDAKDFFDKVMFVPFQQKTEEYIISMFK